MALARQHGITIWSFGCSTVDVHADWQFAPTWSVQAKLNNATDRKYETALGYNQPSRELFVTARYAPK